MGTRSSSAGYRSKSGEASGLLFICGGSRGCLRRPRHSFGGASLRPARLRREAIGAVDANNPVTLDRILDCHDKRACGYEAGTILAAGVAEASARWTIARVSSPSACRVTCSLSDFSAEIVCPWIWLHRAGQHGRNGRLTTTRTFVGLELINWS